MTITKWWGASATLRDVLLPLFVGLVLNAISFYEVGLNAVRFMGPPLGVYLVSASQYYFESGFLGLALATIALSIVATRFWIAWLAFYAPAFVARTVTGTVLFVRGDANMWPIFLAGDIIFAIGSLGIFWVVGKIRFSMRSREEQT